MVAFMLFALERLIVRLSLTVVRLGFVEDMKAESTSAPFCLLLSDLCLYDQCLTDRERASVIRAFCVDGP